MSAEELKAQGNAAFQAKDFTKAADLFGQAINVDPSNHVLFSNRSGAYASMRQFDKALEDADACIKINPTWPKGYGRKGAALHGLGDLLGAHDAYEEALKLDPNNVQAKSGLDAVKASIEREARQDGQQGSDMGMGQIFQDPASWAKLANNPRTKPYLDDQEFVNKLKQAAQNPMSVLSGAQNDPRLMEAIGVMLGIDNLQGPAGQGQPEEQPQRAASPPPQPKKEPTPEPVSTEKQQADEEKAKGNTAYKSRQFDEAIAHYNNAWDLCKDITYLNNRSAAEYEKGDYDAAIATCQQAISEGREMRADYKLVAKAYARIGSVYLKQEDLAKACEYFDKSLTEHRTPDVLNKLRATQKEMHKRENEAYMDPAKADEAREEGNKFFKAADWPAAVKSYSEAVKRAPKDPRGYANRAAALLKLMSYPDAIQDCDKAIDLDKNFFKAYTRKATAQHVMRQYKNCMDTLEQAREIDTENKHTREIEELYQKALNSRFAPLEGETEQQTAERLSQDPEIDEIRRDPVMNSILQQAQNDPAALRDHMKNPEIFRKVNLLIAAGIIKTR